jgi:hypothetical protein
MFQVWILIDELTGLLLAEPVQLSLHESMAEARAALVARQRTARTLLVLDVRAGKRWAYDPGMLGPTGAALPDWVEA